MENIFRQAIWSKIVRQKSKNISQVDIRYRIIRDVFDQSLKDLKAGKAPGIDRK